jgi:hypothetical protein
LGSRHNNIVIAGSNNCFDNEPTRSKRKENQRKVNLTPKRLKCPQRAQALEEADLEQEAHQKLIQRAEHHQQRAPGQSLDPNLGLRHHMEALLYSLQQTPTLNLKKHS